MGQMGTYMVHVPLHVFRPIMHGTLPKWYWGLLSLIMLIRRSTGCFKWYFWIFEHLAKCTNGHCQCHWCSDVSRSGLCIHNTLTISYLFDNLTSFWHLFKLKPPQPVTGLFFNLNHLSPSQGYFFLNYFLNYCDFLVFLNINRKRYKMYWALYTLI